MSGYIDIDFSKHIMISKEMEKVIKKHLSERFSEDDAKIYWNKVLQQYALFLLDLPDLGKKKSRHNEPGGTYDCISIFAYYEGRTIQQKEGVRYRFERCPIAEFAKSHGYLNIMPAFCNSDYSAMEHINAALIRKHTCANSDICDYWIVGDKSKEAQEHPRKTDEHGYWYNE